MIFNSPVSFKVSVLLLLSLGTIMFFNLYDRYTVIGPELIADGHFHGNLSGWEHSGQGVSVLAPGAGIARLDSDNPANIVDLSQTIHDVERYPLLGFSCDIKTHNIPEGRGSWNAARVLLIFHNQEGAPMYRLPHALAILHGTRDWEHHEGVFAVGADVARVRVSAQLAQATGTMWIKNLSLRPLAEKVAYRKFHNVAILLWAAAVLWIAAPLVRSAYGNTHRTAIIVLALAIVFGVLMPENFKEYIGSSLFPSLAEPAVTSLEAATFKFTPFLSAPDIYKAGHFVMFAMLGAAAFYRRPYPVSRARLLGYLVLFALVTEVLQIFAAGRSAQFGDLLIDSAGIVMGFISLRAIQIFFLS